MSETQSSTMTSGKLFAIIVGGVLAALVIGWGLLQLSQPSDLDCAVQGAEVATGDRVAVDDACPGG
ncbi:MAG TPA: hypothetical protein VJL80_10040 [Aeromicrobium sp.]|nr:hypothetical protein [Aeromicrobium sp.]HKY58367.1 hypothetical protein [Aeromicrobium sp.]